MLKREWGAERNGKLQHLTIPGKTVALVSEFSVEDLASEELEPWFLCLQRRTCPWAEHSAAAIILSVRILLFQVNDF